MAKWLTILFIVSLERKTLRLQIFAYILFTNRRGIKVSLEAIDELVCLVFPERWVEESNQTV